jgi:hypothetical protein
VLQALVRLFHETYGAFPNDAAFHRALRLGVGLLTSSQRATITSMLTATGCTDRDWTAFYRVFSRDEWSPRALFDVPKRHLLARLPRGVPAIAALDDTKLHKSGKHTPGVSYQRDPMSPPFHTNLIRAQRFAQVSLSVPFRVDAPAASRCIPVDFRHVPPPAKPAATASTEQWAAYRSEQRIHNLSHAGVAMITALREDIDRLDDPSRPLLMTVDGSYTNATVLRNLPARTTLIGRVRKDARFFLPPAAQPSLGRKRLYGELAPTPEQLRLDDTVPWQSVRIFASGAIHQCQVKAIGPLLWEKARASLPLRLVVIRPLTYKLSAKGRVLYRQPAYLISTDLSLSLDDLVRAYFTRWDIEVNHRDEKQLIGVGQAQVRSAKSVERVPAFAVAMYSLLLVAHGQIHGFDASAATTAIPRWRAHSGSTRFRVPTGEMLEQLRGRSSAAAIASQPNFTHFAERVARHKKCPKSRVSLANAIQYASA